MSNLKKSLPIGVFDSGVGGLSVLKEIRALLPAEDLYYVADSGFVPYGYRSSEYIIDRSAHIVRFFLAQQVKAIVVACNTATSVAVDHLRSWCPVPIIAMEPAIKPAALHTKSGIVGVLATEQTIGSANVNRLIAEHGQDVRVLLRACSGFVEQVEKGDLNSSVTEALVWSHLQPLIDQGADTMVLGCTHYPFLASMMTRVVGDHIHIIDPSGAIARQLKRKLAEYGQLNDQHTKGTDAFWSSGDLAVSQDIIARLWQQPVTIQALPTMLSEPNRFEIGKFEQS